MRRSVWWRGWPRLARPLRTPAAPSGLPWWGLILTSRDKRLLTALLESGDRLRTLMQHPGWGDVEAVFQDWIARYAGEAGRLGKTMENHHGQMVLRESDTPEDDRRRLIACAQSAALNGVLAELHQRAMVGDQFLKRQEQEHMVRGREAPGLV